jgi:hypothetical protein
MMREIDGTELLGGSDHEFVVNLYTVVLNRWPDEEGYRHYLRRIENRPDQRRAVIEEVAGSAEARSLGVVLRFSGEPSPPPAGPQPAPAAASAGELASVLAGLQARLADMPAAELLEAQRLLAETLARITAHQAALFEQRLAALERRAFPTG